ncbi:MAG: hypothetical protein ACXABY_29795 [Candidatus Thorarchaeota archaeon]
MGKKLEQLEPRRVRPGYRRFLKKERRKYIRRKKLETNFKYSGYAT